MNTSNKNDITYLEVNESVAPVARKNNFYAAKARLLLLVAGFIFSTGYSATHKNTILPTKHIVKTTLSETSVYGEDNKRKRAVSDTTDCLEVSGKFDGLTQDFNGFYTATLILDNKPIAIQQLNVKRSFVFVLNKNGHYTVKLEKEGYIPRLVSISTKITDKLDDRNSYVFSFETSLISGELAGGFDDDDVDFPFALISYNKDCDCFEYSREYTSSLMRRMLHSLLFGG